MKKIFTIAILSISMILSSVGCSNSNQIEKSDKLKIYASFYPIEEVVKKVGRDKVEIKSIVPSGVEPHHYEISSKERGALEESDLIFINGLEMEPWGENLESELNEKVIALGEKVNPLKLEAHDEHENHDSHDEHNHGDYDPHVWLDPIRMKEMTAIVAAELSKIDEENSNYYQENAKEYISKLEDLDREYKEELASFKNKKAIVSHDAFGYLGDRYKIDFLGVSGISPEEEPSLKKMGEIVELIKKDNLKVVFFEELTSSKVAKSISEETGARTDVLYTIEGISEKDKKDGMGYIELMKRNLESLKKAFEEQN